MDPSSAQCFRKLCNVVKARLLEVAASECENSKTRKRGLDVGSGRGGDLLKWAAIAPQHLTCVDSDATALDEARRRARRVLADSRFSIDFVQLDVGSEHLAIEAESVDIACCHFALQRIASSAERLRFLFAQVSAALRKGGVFVAVVPFVREGLGHLRIKAVAEAHGSSFAQYEYALSDDDWTLEFRVPRDLLCSSLAAAGFEAIARDRDGDATFTLSCGEFMDSYRGWGGQAHKSILRGQVPDDVDMLTLEIFHVVLCRKVS